MSGIHYAIMVQLQAILEKALITDINDIAVTRVDPTLDENGDPVLDEDGNPETHVTVVSTHVDPTQAGAVQIGPLQGNPDPDVARISVEIYENDPDRIEGIPSGSRSTWEDEVEEIECGGAITWLRRFSVKARCLFVNTRETPRRRQPNYVHRTTAN